MSDQFVTLAQASRQFSISQETLRRWCREGRLPHVKVGAHYRIAIDALTDALALNYGQDIHAAPTGKGGRP